jgi:hypothetical protein
VVVFEPICKSKNDFLTSYSLGIFLPVLKYSNFFSFLPHAQPAEAFCYRMLNMCSTFFSASSACINIMTVLKVTELAEHAKTHFF